MVAYLKKYPNIFIVSLFICLSFLQFNCDITNSKETKIVKDTIIIKDTINIKEKDIEILVPELGVTYETYNTIDIIVKYNTKTASLPGWHYSTNGGKDWEEMTVTLIKKYQSRGDDDFTYEVLQWKPEDDNLKDTEVDVKVTSYDNTSLFFIASPIKIE